MLNHKTEWSVNGGLNWYLVSASEQVGDHSFAVPALNAGTYSLILRITPVDVEGQSVISDPISITVGTDTVMSGLVLALSSVQGTLYTSFNLIVSCSGSVTVNNAVTTGIRLSGNAAGLGSGVAAAVTAIPITGAAAGSVTLFGTLLKPIQLNGVSVAAGVITGAITTLVKLVGNAPGVGSGVGTLLTQLKVAGTMSGAVVLVGGVTTGIKVNTSAAGSGVGSADLTTAAGASVPDAPSLTATPIDLTHIDVAFTYTGGQSVDEVKIWGRAGSGYNAVEVAAGTLLYSGGLTTPYHHTVGSGETWSYVAKAHNAGGDSGYSDVESATAAAPSIDSFETDADGWTLFSDTAEDVDLGMVSSTAQRDNTRHHGTGSWSVLVANKSYTDLDFNGQYIDGYISKTITTGTTIKVWVYNTDPASTVQLIYDGSGVVESTTHDAWEELVATVTPGSHSVIIHPSVSNFSNVWIDEITY